MLCRGRRRLMVPYCKGRRRDNRRHRPCTPQGRQRQHHILSATGQQGSAREGAQAQGHTNPHPTKSKVLHSEERGGVE